MNEIIINKCVEKYGEKYRKLFQDALEWADSQEHIWQLNEPLNKEKFIKELMRKVK